MTSASNATVCGCGTSPSFLPHYTTSRTYHTMGRWTQYEDDAYRLPEGMKRIAYDADTQVYTFRDHNGKLYRGRPGEKYGRVFPAHSDHQTGLVGRPQAFSDAGLLRKRQGSVTSDPPASSFHEILPSNRITSARASGHSYPSPHATLHSFRPSDTGPSPPRVQWIDLVRKAALPKMQGVVHGLRRTVTAARRKPMIADYDETGRLLGRSQSMSTTSIRSVKKTSKT